MPDHDPSDELSPQHAEVRRLLAGARHDEPMPDEVADRLDRVLAGLAEEPARTAPVAQLATRRRRAATLLVAAAAVVAIGVGVGQVLDTGTGSADSLTTADRAGNGQDEDRPEEPAAGGEAEAPGSQSGGSAASESQAGGDTFARLTSRRYGDGVLELRSLRSAGLDGDAAGRGAFSAAGKTCLSDTWGAGTFVPVRYEGIPAVLVFRRARGDTQIADLFLCGESTPHRSVTLPAP